MTAEEQILKSEEVADEFRVSIRQITNLASSGKIPGAFKVGGVWRFTRSGIQEYIRSKTLLREEHSNA